MQHATRINVAEVGCDLIEKLCCRLEKFAPNCVCELQRVSGDREEGGVDGRMISALE